MFFLIHMLTLMFVIFQFFTQFSYMVNILLQPVCDVSSQSCDLYAEIYGVHQSGNKHIKKFFYRETQPLQYFCWTYGYSLHLGYLAPASMKNNATVCMRVDCFMFPHQHFSSKATVSLCLVYLFRWLQNIYCSSSL